MSEVQDTVSSTLTDLSSVTADVTDETLLNDLNDLGESITDLGNLISSGGLLGAAPGPGRSKRETGFCSLMSLFWVQIDFSKIQFFLAQIVPGFIFRTVS